MKLYRIRRKSDGKYFGGLIAPWSSRHKGKIHWYDKGVFYQNIDTAVKWCEVLCGKWYNPTCRRWTATTVQVTNVDRKKLKLYEIVINDVSLNNENVIQAKDIVK